MAKRSKKTPATPTGDRLRALGDRFDRGEVAVAVVALSVGDRNLIPETTLAYDPNDIERTVGALSLITFQLNQANLNLRMQAVAKRPDPVTGAPS